MLRVAGLQLGQRQLVAGHAESRLELDDPLKGRDRLGRLPLGEMDAAANEQSLDVGRVLLEHRLKLALSLIRMALGERDFRLPSPGRQIATVLRRHVRENGLGSVALACANIELRQFHPRRRAGGR